MPVQRFRANAADARRAGLRYTSDDTPGITREAAEGGFAYRFANGRPVRAATQLARIAALAIPPAWTEVWICADPRGHIQATGRDARGRKQYRYHDRWRDIRDGAKFAHMAAFGRTLPAIRARAAADLAIPGLSHAKVVATVVTLLEATLIRVGNDEYARANRSFGLTTLRARHVRAEAGEVRFVFRGKAGVQHRAGVRDRRIVRIVRRLQELPGQRLFRYQDEDGELRPVGSADVNAWLGEAAGAAFTAKDFRTWAGTLAAARALARQPPPASAAEAKRVAAQCVKETAGLLGNTPAVCRAAYIHPAVLEAFTARALPAAFADPDDTAFEAAVLAFLDALARRRVRPAPSARTRKPASRSGAGRSPPTAANRRATAAARR